MPADICRYGPHDGGRTVFIFAGMREGLPVSGREKTVFHCRLRKKYYLYDFKRRGIGCRCGRCFLFVFDMCLCMTLLHPMRQGLGLCFSFPDGGAQSLRRAVAGVGRSVARNHGPVRVFTGRYDM